jgi:hypothetical protein
MEIWWILNGFMDIYHYNMGIRRTFNDFTALLRKYRGFLNGFTAFYGNMEEI